MGIVLIGLSLVWIIGHVVSFVGYIRTITPHEECREMYDVAECNRVVLYAPEAQEDAVVESLEDFLKAEYPEEHAAYVKEQEEKKKERENGDNDESDSADANEDASSGAQ